MTNPVKGFAVTSHGEVDLRTVSNTEVAAMVNGIAHYGGYNPLAWPDSVIRMHWNDVVKNRAPHEELDLVRVSVVTEEKA